MALDVTKKQGSTANVDFLTQRRQPKTKHSSQVQHPFDNPPLVQSEPEKISKKENKKTDSVKSEQTPKTDIPEVPSDRFISIGYKDIRGINERAGNMLMNLLLLNFYVDDEGFLSLSQSQIAKILNIKDTRGVRRILSEMEKNGLISTSQKSTVYGLKKQYRLEFNLLKKHLIKANDKAESVEQEQA